MKHIHFCCVALLLVTPVVVDGKKQSNNCSSSKSTLAEFQKLSASFEQIKHAVQRELSLTETTEQPKQQEPVQPVAQQTEKVEASLEQLSQDHLDVVEGELPKQGKSKASDSELRVWCGMLGISVFSTLIGAHLQKQNLKQEMHPLFENVAGIDQQTKNLDAAYQARMQKLEQELAELRRQLHEREARFAGDEGAAKRNASAAADH
jgi:hypothetical protein